VIAGILCRFQDIAMDRYKFKASLCLILHLHPAETPVNVFHHLILPKTQNPAVPHGKNRSCKNFAVWPVSLTISDTNTHEVNMCWNDRSISSKIIAHFVNRKL